MGEVTSQDLHEKLARFYRGFRGYSYQDEWTERMWGDIERLEAREGVRG